MRPFRPARRPGSRVVDCGLCVTSTSPRLKKIGRTKPQLTRCGAAAVAHSSTWTGAAPCTSITAASLRLMAGRQVLLGGPQLLGDRPDDQRPGTVYSSGIASAVASLRFTRQRVQSKFPSAAFAVKLPPLKSAPVPS